MSVLTCSGTSARAWSASMRSATSPVAPIVVMTPPTPSSATQRRAASNASLSTGRYADGIHGTTIWATFRSSGSRASVCSTHARCVASSTIAPPGSVTIGAGVHATSARAATGAAPPAGAGGGGGGGDEHPTL
jgi:hypothetical protein